MLLQWGEGALGKGFQALSRVAGILYNQWAMRVPPVAVVMEL